MARSAKAKTAPPAEPPIARPPEPGRFKASKDQLLDFYKEMLLIRRFEERAGQLYGLGLIGGFCHLYIGQEAVAVGLQSAMTVGKDSVITGYRDHGHMLAYGIDPKVIMAELTGREAGISKEVGTVHGMRSAFRDWVSEETSFPGDVAEAALAHTIKNKVEAAYRRGDLFEKRRRLMDEWATFCAKPYGETNGILVAMRAPRHK